MNKHTPGDLLDAGPAPSSLAPEGIARRNNAGACPESKCHRCGEAFTPRGPGKPQKFCSPACRRAYHDRGDGLEGPAPKRGQTPTFEAENSEAGSLQNPRAESGVYIDHSRDGGPVLHVPESDLKHVDRIGRDMEAEEAAEEATGEPSDGDLVIPEQPRTWVYCNRQNQIVVRQYAGPMMTPG